MSDERIEFSTGNEARTLAGRYRLLNVLGAGAMGEVFLAEDTRLQRTVAVKSLRPKWCEDEAFLRRIKRECLLHAKIGAHPNIVTLYDVVDEGTSLHLIMEYVEGETLQERMDRQVPTASPLFVKERINIVIQCLNALAHTQNQGIVHRDIKPANIILVPGESGSTTVKVTDFGIARFEEGSSELTSLTSAGEQTPGTPLFMAPEQIDSAKYGKVTPATDIYATGVMLYYMLSGSPPFQGTLTDIFNAHLNFTPKPILLSAGQTLHTRLSKAIEKAMSKKPGDRFPSARAFEEELRAILASNEPLVVTKGDSSLRRLSSGLNMIKRRPRLLFATVAGAVIILLAAFLFGRISSVTNESLNPLENKAGEPRIVQPDNPVPTPQTGGAQAEDTNGTTAPPSATVASEELVLQISPRSQAPDILAEMAAVIEGAEVVPIEEKPNDVVQTKTVTEPVLESAPMPRTYVVQSGDTLAGIAERFKLDTLKLARWNLIENPNNLFAGQKLYLYERPDLPPVNVKPTPPPKSGASLIRALENVFTESEHKEK